MSRENVFVLGLDERNRRTLPDLPHLQDYSFHGLLHTTELLTAGRIPFGRLVQKATDQLRSFPGSIDAVVGYWDFPVSTMVPILCDRFGLHSASIEAVVCSEHKYWSRLEQRKAIDEVPAFTLVDLGAEGAAGKTPDLRRPFWLKPVKSFGSQLAFRIERPEDYAAALQAIRERIDHFAEPFDAVLDYVDLPPEIAEVGARSCIAEEALSGAQATVEGYVYDREAHTYGVVDSVPYPDRPSFLRYQYPSALPRAVTERMCELSKRVVRRIGLNWVAFNVEFFWDEDRDALGLLEINPRHSQSHAPLFDYVDGAPNHHVMIELGLGREPHLPRRNGRYAVGAKWHVRRFEDGIVRRIPTAEEIERAQRMVPGTVVDVLVREGDRLADLSGQDSYSYVLAHVFAGARDETELTEKYERCLAELPFEFETVTEDWAGTNGTAEERTDSGRKD